MITLKGFRIFLSPGKIISFTLAHRVDGAPIVLLHVLIVEVPLRTGVETDPANPEGVPELWLVPEFGVDNTLHRVASHVGGGQSEETWEWFLYIIYRLVVPLSS